MWSHGLKNLPVPGCIEFRVSTNACLVGVAGRVHYYMKLEEGKVVCQDRVTIYWGTGVGCRSGAGERKQNLEIFKWDKESVIALLVPTGQ